ncbi:LamG-like jellyroll fold domain-containing protein [Christiangramia sediminis]|uniref:T9SS type A sorting domain-containing protein n=1 Tax=Christiangramia sediminis TaxID=2881336 RepID=A0A9X1LJD5_9FLAO|nr:LamG-like jellyroll fold domain-containing protein [Christiangramia sediminis]MCB7481456.1 T9SS type A sorting domain-containing protein [Christiangramia sediminis]
MYKTTFGPRIHYVITLTLIFLTLSVWTSGELFAQEISANIDAPTCADASDGAIDVTVTGGTAPYSYSWSGPGVNSNTSQDLSNLTAGNYTLSVTDSNSSSIQKTFELSFIDDQLPTIVTKSININLDNNGQRSISPADVDNGSSDNCGIDTITLNKSNFDCTNIGDNTVTLTVTDVNGNSASQTATVTVEDNIVPTVQVQNFTVQLDASGNANITPEDIDNGSSDNCAVDNISLNKTAFDCSNVGVNNTVTLTVTDVNGNSASQTATVTVEDNIVPTVQVQNFRVQLDASGNANITPEDIDNGSSDNCAVNNISLNKTTFDCSNVGVNNTVTLTVTDVNGNSSSQTATVTVEDNIVPTVQVQNFTVQLDASGNANITPEDIDNGSSDNCAVDNISLNKTTFDCSNVAVNNTVTLTVTDVNGNSASQTATVTVEDNILPVISAGDDIEATNDTGICQAGLGIAPATATDNCSVGNPSGIRSDGLGLDEPYPVGTTTITWNVQDANGNEAEQVVQNVVVLDNEPPEIPTIEDITWGCEYTVEAPVTVDNCSGEIIGTTTDPLTYSNAGTYTINWIFTDDAGNSSSTTQNIIIDPVIAQATKVDVLCNGLATGEVEATATGGIAPLTYNWGSLGPGAKKTDLPAGTYTVTVTDANGCTADPVSVTVNEPDTFIEIVDVKTTSGCFGENNGTATVTAQGGTGDYTYLWDNGQTTQTATNLAPGTHTVTISDANECSKERTVTVSQPTELKITGFLTTETTSFGSATGTATAQVSGGTPGYTFAWTGGPSNISKTGQTARDLPAGTYTVTVTDSNQCTATEQIEVVDALSANIVPISLCEEGELIRTSTFSVENGTAIGGTAPYTYSWDYGERANPATGTGVGPTDVTYDNIGEKLIILTVTDAEGREFEQRIIQYVGGCFADDCGSNDLGLENYFIGDSSKNEITSANCDTADEKFIYINFPTNATRYSLQIELIYSVEDIESGEISNYKVTDCFFNKDDIPKVAQTFSIDYDCGDIVKVEGIYLTFQNNKKDACGTTQGNGNNPKCFSTNNEATVSSPLFAVAFANELLCNGASNGTVTYRASGGSGNYSFDLLNSAGNIVNVPNSGGIFTEVSAGKYRVKVTDTDSGDTYITKEVEITQPSNPLEVSSISQTDVSCFGGSDGSATITAVGGTPDYIYVWPDGQTGPTATNLAAGTYEVSIIDANGCEILETVTIEQPAELIANAGPDQVLGCGFNSTQLDAEVNLDINNEPVPGVWTIVNGPSGGSFTDATIPNTIFKGNQGTYTLRWSVDCGKSDDVKITFTNCSTLDFDGIDDHVNFGDNYGFTGGPFTFEAWIKPKSKDGSRTILSKKDISNPSGGFELKLTNGVPSIEGIGVSGLASNNVDTDRWYHIAVSFDGSTATLYVDGIPLGSKGNATNPVNTSAPFILGATYDSSAPNNPKNFFHGWMEEVRLWSKSLSVENIRLLMNQRISSNNSKVRGEIIPIDAEGLSWTDLQGYYRLLPGEVSNGVTFDIATNKINGKLINIKTTQENTAPLPYISSKNGLWRDKTSWLRPTVWDVPNSLGINSDTINWNIAITSHVLNSDYKNIELLGLISKAGTNESSKLVMDGSVVNETGNELYISHYLELNGVIDLNGESQLIQPEGSILEGTASGYLDRDQQGTANSFNYNYWTPPVSLQNINNNVGFKLEEVLRDGTKTSEAPKIKFNEQYHWADGNYSGIKRISRYWLWTFHGLSDDYSEWSPISESDQLPPGLGYTMKGTTGYVDVNRKQNYTFRGKPNNGNIKLSVDAGNDILIGNPYPSAIDANAFINDNSSSFNGAIYYWDHFGPSNSHYLEDYVGGYAIYNKSGGVASLSTKGSRAVSDDWRIDDTGEISGKAAPGRYIPVGQAFFISSSSGGEILFKNSHRFFVTEKSEKSQFHMQEKTNPKKDQTRNATDSRFKIRLKFESPKGYHRQILVTADANASGGFDLGYDAPLIENNVEDMYWMIDETEFVIQAVPNFNLDQVLPLGIKLSEEGEYTIKIDELENIKTEFNIYLKDNLNDTYTNLSKEDYTTTAQELGYFNERYEIVFKKQVAEKPIEEIPEELEQPQLGLNYLRNTDEIAVLNPDLLQVDHVELYSISGQLIKSFQEVPTERSILLSIDQKLSSAVYIVKMYSGEKVYSRKVIITK